MTENSAANSEEQDAPELSAEAEAWFLGRLRLNTSLDPPAVGVDRVVRYLSGALAEADAREIERRAIRDSGLRRTIVQARAEMDRLEQMPWQEVLASQRGQEPNLREVAAAWRTVADEQMRAKGEMHGASDLWSLGIDAVRRQASEGAAAAQAAWTDFCSFARQWKMALRQPRLVAEVRGHESSPSVGTGWPEGCVAFVEAAEIDDAGTLRASIHILGSAGETPTPAEGRTAYLGIAFGGEVWPVAAEVVRDSRADWAVYGIGRLLDLPAMQVPPEFLRVEVDRVPSRRLVGEELGHESSLLIAEVVADPGAYRASDIAVVHVVRPAACENGLLRLNVALPLATRTRYPAGRLELAVAISPGDHQLLGEWPVASWPAIAELDEGPSTLDLSIDWPGCPEGLRIPASSLRARIYPH